jgi:hypothetical protein
MRIITARCDQRHADLVTPYIYIYIYIFTLAAGASPLAWESGCRELRVHSGQLIFSFRNNGASMTAGVSLPRPSEHA